MNEHSNDFILQRLGEIHKDMTNGFAMIQRTQEKKDEEAAEIDKRVTLLEERWKWVATGIVAAFAALIPHMREFFSHFLPAK